MNEHDVFDPYDMDREEFNPYMAMLRYAKECNLPNMLSRQKHVEREIRDLSCDLRNLLLDNYTKFLNCSSVVSKMKEDFEKMEDETDHLQAKMDAIGETSAAILSNLRPAEKRISHLLKGQETMKKLVLLTELVPTLKRHVESGVYVSAAKHYLRAEPLLKKYRHLASLNGIVRDCADVILVVRSGLFNMLNCDIYRDKELSETLNLLLSLGESPVSVATYFLSSSRKYLIVHLSSIEGTWIKYQKENKNNQLKNAVVNYIGMCCTHVEKIDRIVTVLKEVYTYKSCVNTKNSVDDLLSEFFSQSIDQLSRKLQQRIIEQFQTLDEDFLSQILDKFNRQCYSSGIVTNKINFYEIGMDIIVRICSARCEFHLKNMEDNFSVTLFNIEKEMSPTTNVQKLLNFLTEWTELKLTEVLKSVTYYMRPEFRFCREADFRNAFCKTLVLEGIFMSFFRHINNKIWITVSSRSPKQCNSSLMCLVYSKYLFDLKKNVIPKFLIKMDENLCPSESLSSDANILSIFSNASRKLLEYYTNIRSSNMICMIRKSMESKNWLECKEPTRPRLVIKMILNELQDIKAETERIFGASENPRGLKNSPRTKEIGNPVLNRTNSVDSLSDQNSIEERILLNKLFKDCSSKGSKVEPDTYSILNCTVEKTLKSFIEYVRMYTFNSFGLQQIQVDVYVLQSYTSKLLDISNNSFQAVFDEILSSAYNRSLNAQFMNNQIVSMICSKTF